MITGTAMRHPFIVLIATVFIAGAPATAHAQQYYSERPGGITPTSYSVVKILAGGQFVVLQDGSKWEIAPEDRPVSAAWTRGQSIVLSPIGAPTGEFDTQFTNGEADRHAASRFAGRVRLVPGDTTASIAETRSGRGSEPR
ncbi:MAG: hypothetical protein ABJD11_16880 [Gemmatimonadota bacterium]